MLSDGRALSEEQQAELAELVANSTNVTTPTNEDTSTLLVDDTGKARSERHSSTRAASRQSG